MNQASNDIQAIVGSYVESHIHEFHDTMLHQLKNLSLRGILRRKNPYLFRVKNLLTAEEIIRSFLEAFLSSREETIFWAWLESLAIFVNENTFGWWKSSTQGIDLEFFWWKTREIRYIVSIKSWPNWGNSSQIAKMCEDFRRAKKVIRQSDPDIRVEAINGCCYWRRSNPDKWDYSKYCGERFWAFISWYSSLYTDIIVPLGHEARQHSEVYQLWLAKIINTFSQEFHQEFCHQDGTIDWQKIISINSSISGKG